MPSMPTTQKRMPTRDAKAALAKLHDYSARELARRSIERRAVEAAIWGIPLVSMAAMRAAFFRDAGARYNDIVYFSQPADWRFQFTTPNASTYYVYFNFNTKDGPVVLELPSAEDAGLFGSFVNAWQEPIVDIGPEGEDRGRGGKYVILPPNDLAGAPDRYIPVHPGTSNGYALFRTIPHSASETDIAAALALVRRIRLYPLASASDPPRHRHIDMSGKLFDGTVPFDDTLFAHLARMVNEEDIETRDLVAMRQLRSLGIRKGEAFAPDDEMRGILDAAAGEAQAGFMEGLRGGTPFFPGTQWKLLENIGARTGFTFQTDDALYIDERALIYYMAFAAPKNLGAGTFYLMGANDSTGHALHGEDRYRLTVPAKVPVRQYWAVTVYDCESACFMREAPSISIDSFQQTEKNADGSVDVYFGPTPPEGQDSNWIYTEPGKRWFALFRFYGPEPALFDKSWTLTDIEEIL